MHLVGGAALSKEFHLVTHGCHWTPLDMAGSAVHDRLSLDSVLLRREEDTDKVCLCKNNIGGSYGVVGLLSNDEFDALDSERAVGSICAALALLAGPEDE